MARHAVDRNGRVCGPFADLAANVARDLVERYRKACRDSKAFIREAKPPAPTPWSRAHGFL
ncbi:hypothetical protein ACFY12_16820 [Streptomyces sp. NPDC001339]|uniref:hypothetical protein n=1 Tax=Streptomyces sp. NPDC001339 TaxID=3364563 RepID=UPI003683C50E